MGVPEMRVAGTIRHVAVSGAAIARQLRSRANNGGRSTDCCFSGDRRGGLGLSGRHGCQQKQKRRYDPGDPMPLFSTEHFSAIIPRYLLLILGLVQVAMSAVTRLWFQRRQQLSNQFCKLMGA